jgi:hypothetical protein
MLAAARGALSERRPVASDVLNLSALASARSGTANDALTTKEREGEWLCLEIKGVREEILLTSNWRSPTSSSSRAGGTSTVPTGASAVPAGTSTDYPAMGGSVPASGVDCTAAPLARGDGGAGSHLSEVVCSPSLSSSSYDEFANAERGERPCCSRSRYSSLY